MIKIIHSDVIEGYDLPALKEKIEELRQAGE